MTVGNRALVAEVALYGVAVWLSYEMAKTPEQRLQDRLKRLYRLYRAGWWLSRSIAQLAMQAELAYHREVSP